MHSYDPTGCLREDQLKRRRAMTITNIGTGCLVVLVLYVVCLIIWS
jgi:hypothetical protein